MAVNEVGLAVTCFSEEINVMPAESKIQRK